MEWNAAEPHGNNKGKQHSITHNSTNTCGQCGKSFGCFSDLKRHKQTVHEGFRPHSCNQREKSFTSSAGSKIHKQTVHDVCVISSRGKSI